MPDWTEDRYVRVFVTLAETHPEVWDDDRALAWWLRLLVAADAAWPGLAEYPRRLPVEVEGRLVEAGIIRPQGDSRYTVAGLTKLRQAGLALSVRGGRARARGPRDAMGRLLPSRVEPSGLVQPAGPTNGAAPRPAGDQPAGDAAASRPSSPVQPDQPTNPDQTPKGPSQAPLGEVSRTTPRASRQPPRGVQVDCDDPNEHQLGWTSISGVGWRCLVCERARRDQGPRFSERVPWPGTALQEDDDDSPF